VNSSKQLNARDIFTAAEDFRLSFLDLGGELKDGSQALFERTIGPGIVLAAFASELYFKCMLVDAGAPSFPKRHNLTQLFLNLSPKSRSDLKRLWEEIVQPNPQTAKAVATNLGASILKLEDFLSEHADSFENWRYRFENPGTLKQDKGAFVILHEVQIRFILSSHPDWGDDTSHFLSTFPAL
jgi:hypothetical protein